MQLKFFAFVFSVTLNFTHLLLTSAMTFLVLTSFFFFFFRNKVQRMNSLLHFFF